jgi:hypothetical protein
MATPEVKRMLTDIVQDYERLARWTEDHPSSLHRQQVYETILSTPFTSALLRQYSAL